MQLSLVKKNIQKIGRISFEILFVFLFSLNLTAFEGPEDILKRALDEKIFDEKRWLRLLHLHNNKPDIDDSLFYIGGKFSNAKDEFELLYRSFFIENNQNVKCRFPARFEWMKRRLNLNHYELGHCAELEEFQKNAPIENVTVAFAAENLISPTSMMGHVFLKISGHYSEKELREHSISFFTNAENITVTELILKSLFTGMKGYYTLSPYQIQVNNYLHKEQRNIWEYELDLSEENRKLIELHLFELKHISFTYFFHGFNCATLINNILNVAYPDLDDERSLWVTPLDVVRSITDHDVIRQTMIHSSSEWKLQSLLESVKLDSQEKAKIKKREYETLNLEKYNLDSQYMILELAKTHDNYLYEENKISQGDWKEKTQFLQNEKEKIFPDAQLNSFNYKKPGKTIQDSQFFFDYTKRDVNKLVRFGFLPASHDLQDDTINYSNESELKLGELVLSYETDHKKIKLDEVNLYSAIMLRASDFLTNGWSKKFQISYAPYVSEVNSQLVYDHYYYAGGGLGKTYRFFKDLDVYAILSSSLMFNEKFSLQLGPEVGMILREIGNMKTLVTYKKQFSTSSSLSEVDELRVTQVLNSKKFSFGISYGHFFKNSDSIKDYALTVKRFF